MKRKKIFSILLTIVIVFIPVVHAQANTNVMKIIPVSVNADVMNAVCNIMDFLEKTPLSQELFWNYLDTENGKDVMAYWEDDVDWHIKNGIIENSYYQNMLQDVLKLAYKNGHYKIDFISDDTMPDYYEPSFNETRYNQPIEFNEGDLFYAIHGVNGHLVIDATYLGNNQFEVWVALQDYYDFAFDENCNYGILCSVTNYLYLQKEIMNIGHEFYTDIGFTYRCTWEPNTVSNETGTNEQIVSNGIEQTANGDNIETVRCDDPIYNDSIDYEYVQNTQDELDIMSVEEGEFICEYTIKKIPVYESATSSNIRYYIINDSRNNVYKMVFNKKYILQDGTIRYSKSAGDDIEFLGEPD